MTIGSAEFDSSARMLLRGGAEVRLTPKAYQLLELLVERRPDAVSKEEIQERLWPKTFVSEGNLTVLMTELRKALNDDGTPQLVRTVRGFGYALAVEADAGHAPRAGPSSLWIAFDEHACPLVQGENVLGRDAEAHVRVDRLNVSRRHAVIRVDGGRATLEDLESKNGTLRNGVRLTAPTVLQPGDEIGLGSFSVRFCAGMASTKTECR
jgi:DNA-binding winged helix-turn-helix (wHTH) protein